MQRIFNLFDDLRRWVERQSPKTNSLIFGTLGLIIGGLIAPYGYVCWHVGPVGECLEQGYRGTFVVSAITGAIFGAVFGRHISDVDG